MWCVCVVKRRKEKGSNGLKAVKNPVVKPYQVTNNQLNGWSGDRETSENVRARFHSRGDEDEVVKRERETFEKSSKRS
jgi:hypothetical protein